MAHVPEDPEKLKKKKKKKDGDDDDHHHTDEEMDYIADETPPPPDGGWGWAVVFASFMIHIVSKYIYLSFFFTLYFILFFK